MMINYPVSGRGGLWRGDRGVIVGIKIDDWWADAGLWMQSTERDGPPIEVASGSLVEIVGMARSTNRAEQGILFITSPALDHDLAATQVRVLAERCDFPVLI